MPTETSNLSTQPFRFRPIKEPTIPLPIACRSTGHYRTPAGWHRPGMVKHFVELFWGIRGEGRFLARGREYILHPNHVLILYSGDLHDSTAVTDWEFRWMTLDGRLPDQLTRAFGLGEEPIEVGPCPSELFIRLAHEIEDVSPQGQRNASATAYDILSLAMPAGHDTPKADRQFNDCLQLIKTGYADPELNVSALARTLGLHRTSLSKLFAQKMRMSPVEYLILYRVSKAVKLLQSTTLPVHEVAELTGFSCPNYLTNVLRKRVGMNPRELRSMTPRAPLSASD